MKGTKKIFGKKGEEYACRFLQEEKGYKIIEKNYTCPLGELDVVADDGGVLVFIEVRSCRSTYMEMAVDSIGIKKQKKLRRLAAYYLKEKGSINRSCRFDALIISFIEQEGRLQPGETRHLINFLD